jgi:hypothetical protein
MLKAMMLMLTKVDIEGRDVDAHVWCRCWRSQCWYKLITLKLTLSTIFNTSRVHERHFNALFSLDNLTLITALNFLSTHSRRFDICLKHFALSEGEPHFASKRWWLFWNTGGQMYFVGLATRFGFLFALTSHTWHTTHFTHKKFHHAYSSLSSECT